MAASRAGIRTGASDGSGGFDPLEGGTCASAPKGGSVSWVRRQNRPLPQRFNGRDSGARGEPHYMDNVNMNVTIGDTPKLEIALLRRGLDGQQQGIERCHGCRRGMLIGERVYEYESGALLCALCRDAAHRDPVDSHLVHGPAFGHSIRVMERRAA